MSLFQSERKYVSGNFFFDMILIRLKHFIEGKTIFEFDLAELGRVYTLEIFRK
jgi:hypothetical protein